MMITGARRVVMGDRIMYCCTRCGGYYTTERQASTVANDQRSHSGYAHACRARPK
jgi:hypothetical protein